MAEQDLDRSEAATPYKLQKARERGQTPRSTEVPATAAFAVALAWLSWQGLDAWRALLGVAQRPLLRAGDLGGDAVALWALVSELLVAAAAILWPLLAALVLAAIAAAVAQNGVVFSWEPLRMDFDRLNPASGCKRLCSMRTLFDAGRACVKLLVLSVSGWVALRGLLPQFPGLSGVPPAEFVRVLVDDVGSLGLKMALALAVVACADLAFTRREFGRRMRMSRRELKDEYRNREGDPRIRERLRQLRREMLRRSRSLNHTRDADVVLANPTHYAVALRYVHGEMEAPRVIAKGAGQLAAAMRAIAARHGIVVVQNPSLARRLFREAPLDAYLPPGFHAEVARIIVWVLAARRQREQRAAGVDA